MANYQCHKKVKAWVITSIAERSAKSFTLGLEDGDDVVIGAKFMKKHKPEIGNYLVIYDDGYKSISPAEAFEAGYTIIK